MSAASLFARLSSPERELAEAVHARVAALGPDLVQKLRWNTPAFVGNKDVASVSAVGKGANRHVNLFLFQGAALPNPHGLIEGTGKSMRHIKFYSLADLDRPGVDDAIRAAIALDGDRDRDSSGGGG
ncbi:MAG TPA: DUF1801 domain-containing protein [Devosiaceae bacterium]|nr:DUF1801 domain-containing protein [Devosiaceae bacterium]